MTSSIFPPRNDLAPCSPRTQEIASTTLDLPEPFGPTTAVMPGSKRSVVEDANDLKPRSVRLFRCTRCTPGRGRRAAAVRMVVDRPVAVGAAAGGRADGGEGRGHPYRAGGAWTGCHAGPDACPERTPACIEGRTWRSVPRSVGS